MDVTEGVADKKRKFLGSENRIRNKDYAQHKHVNDIFNKHCSIINKESYQLPQAEVIFKDPLWKIPELQVVKNELNAVKNLLSSYNLKEWQSHTRQRNTAKEVIKRIRRDIQPELMTQAWCKFYEIVSSHPLVPIENIRKSNNRFKSVHLCEAPGAFIVSLNHWLRSNVTDIKWDWVATTLNPYYEGNSLSIMIDDDRFMRHTLNHWCFGEDNTGNLMNLKNLDEIVNRTKDDVILLVTADGSIDCMDTPAEQENVVAHLHFCEVVAAMHLLATGGSFLLKMFTAFECHSVCLIFLLCCTFRKVDIVKPVTSKEGNSETYVVCTDFMGPELISPYLKIFRKYYECGPTQAMFPENDVPHSFIEKIIECGKFFKSQQCQVIMRNILAFQTNVINTTLPDMRRIQHLVADKYMRDYDIKKLESGEIVGKEILEQTVRINTYTRMYEDSYNERCRKQALSPCNKLTDIYNSLSVTNVSIPIDKFVKFKINDPPDDLQIRSGKVFHKINSSRFCDAHSLRRKNAADDIISKLEYKIDYPSLENIDKIANEYRCKPGYSVLIFHNINIYSSYELINAICTKMQSLEHGQNLVLVGYTLLTHLSVGLLYLISCSFNCLKIELRDDLGVQIILEHYNHVMRISKNLEYINSVSCNMQDNGKAILGILPESFLYESDLFTTIVNINHWLIKCFVQHAVLMVGKTMSKDETDL